jgi:hypothetical protein
MGKRSVTHHFAGRPFHEGRVGQQPVPMARERKFSGTRKAA